MAIGEIIRQYTVEIRDSLSHLDTELQKAQTEREAADQREKRYRTEITRQRAGEGELKRQLGGAAANVGEAQRLLDELDRRRQEAIDSLIKWQEEEKTIQKQLRGAQESTETALDETRKEQKTVQDAENFIKRLRAQRVEMEGVFRQRVLNAYVVHMEAQAKQVLTAFDSQQKRARARQAYEEFSRARHSDPEISRLSEQREELQKFLNTAVVPDVKVILQASLKAVEEQLQRRYPGALSPPPYSDDSAIDELLFFCNQYNKAVFLLPIPPAIWAAARAGEISENTSRAMCIVWNFLREMRLKKDDGIFDTRKGWPIFESRFDLEDVAILHDFDIKYDDSVVVRFVLKRVPGELEAVLNYEDENS